MSVWGNPLIIGQAKPDYSGATLEQGNIASADGQNYQNTNTNRIRTHGYIPITDADKYTIGCNLYRVYVHYYASEYVFMTGESVGWITPLPTTITPPSGAKYMRLVLAQSTGDVSPSDVTYFYVDQRIIDQ